MCNREMEDMGTHDLDAQVNPETFSISQLKNFDHKADVKMDPAIFREAARRLRFRPTADMFASASHHQLPRYYAVRHDPKAIGINAFQYDWKREWAPYANPPWDLIGAVLTKVAHDKVTVMSVIPEWPQAPWYPQWQRLCVRSVLYTIPVFLDAQGNLPPRPRWNTRIGILDGNRA